MARLLDSDAFLRGYGGDYGEAVEDILSLLKLGAVVRDQPTLTSQVTAMAIEGMACRAAEFALPAEGIPGDLADRLVEYVGHADLRGKFANSFFGEGLMEVKAFDMIREGCTTEQLTGKPSVMNDLILRAYGSTLVRPWLNMDEETCARTIQSIAQIARLPYYEALPQMHDIEKEVGDLPRTRLLSRWILQIVTPGFTRIIESQARVEAQLDLMRMGISVEQYHSSTGNYPATLEEISPSLAGSMPVGPFTGESYHYQVSGGSFLLYSVGSNLTDDGGTFDFRKGDIVWRGQEKEKD